MKKIFAIALAAIMLVTLFAGCGKTDEKPTVTTTGAEESTVTTTEAEGASKTTGLKIGCAIQTMSNQIWAQQMEAISAACKKDGNEFTVVDCQENSNTQIGQLENFITSEMDLIIVQPVDAEAIEAVCGQAIEAGIKVVCWDEKMENSTFNWVIENYDLGCAIGEQAAAFINEKFGDEGCEVVVLGYPQIPILLERENGIVDTLAKKAPNAKIVANQPALDTTQGLDAMETILQAHPDVKVVCCIGGGGAAGANEALKGLYGTEVPDDVGIFSTDLSEEFIASLQNGEFNRSCIAITGNASACGEEIYKLALKYVSGEETAHEVYRDLIPVTKANLDEMIAK